jgi:hypothetical protein
MATKPSKKRLNSWGCSLESFCQNLIQGCTKFCRKYFRFWQKVRQLFNLGGGGLDHPPPPLIGEPDYPPPLSCAQIDELSRKKQLTKQEARKLLQCYFSEIKNVKYFQLHKYHSCCYDPKHLNLCKNHITALQRECDKSNYFCLSF